MTEKIKGIIFDLDDTLFDCMGQLNPPARCRAARILASACPDLSVETACQQQELLAQRHGSSEAICVLGGQYGISSRIVKRALDAYYSRTVEAIAPFPDALDTLATLVQRGYALALVTAGLPERQREKVHLLGLGDYFSETDNTLILCDTRKTDKGPCLAQAAKTLALPYAQILCVGDKLTEEIAAANTLGMTTVRMRHGLQKHRTPQTPIEQPDCEIDRISQVLSLLKK